MFEGLLSHENGKVISILDEVVISVVPAQVLKAINFNVPQKRTFNLVRLEKILISIRISKPYNKNLYNLKTY
jgi:DNA (cytosine-5)-methyltransferase 1